MHSIGWEDCECGCFRLPRHNYSEDSAHNHQIKTFFTTTGRTRLQASRCSSPTTDRSRCEMERNLPSTANNYTRIFSFSWRSRPISFHSLLSGLLTDGCRLNSSEIIFFLFFFISCLLEDRPVQTSSPLHKDGDESSQDLYRVRSVFVHVHPIGGENEVHEDDQDWYEW